MTNSPHVIVGMSGGVDSSVSAYLLQEKGYKVTGLFMKNWEEDDTEDYCAAAQDLKDAQQVSDTLGIELLEVNFAHEYWENVFTHFLQEYKAGRTPNPDILCNKEIKFKEFLYQAETLGADYIATGHYVAKAKNNTSYQLLKGLDNNKDQSYFLYTLQQEALKKSLFPLGELTKTTVREIANRQGFITHNKKDSTGICFIGERRFKDFLSQYIAPNPGEIVDLEGNCVGKHDGLMYHTIGQRQGLNIGGAGPAWFVAKKDKHNNRLIAVQGHDHPVLLSQHVTINQLHWVSGYAPNDSQSLSAKTRYRQQEASCRITDNKNDVLEVCFDMPQRAVTQGQALVFYHQDQCLGGGTIIEART